MSIAARIPLNVRLWFGLLGAPLVWTVQHLTGYALTEAGCGAASRRSPVAIDTATLVVSATAAACAVLAALFSLTVVLETREASGEHDPPPASRVHFLAVVGMTIAPLFFLIILMSGLGAVLLPNCRQS